MTPEFAIQIIRQTLWTAFWVGAPLLLVGFVVGMVISLVQIVTSVQDTAFGTVPRLCAFVVALILLLPWMLEKMTAYTVAILGDLGRYAK